MQKVVSVPETVCVESSELTTIWKLYVVTTLSTPRKVISFGLVAVSTFEEVEVPLIE